MATSKETPVRILDAAMRTIARRGARRLSMSDVCDTAGISRGTLYRYFKSKDELLEAMGRHVQQELNAALDTAVAARPEPEARLRVVAEALVRHRDRHPEVSMVTEAEPGFALPFIRANVPMFVRRVAELLEPALDTIPSVRSGAAAPVDLAALLLRTMTSVVFIPESDANRLVDTVVAVFGCEEAPLVTPARGASPTRPESVGAASAKVSAGKAKSSPSNL